MKAKNMVIKAVILLGALLISAFLATNLLIGNSSRESGISASARGTIFLARPAFAQGTTTFLDEEAGISAYTDVGQEIDLEMAKLAFRTIEYETDEYIVGSVPLSGHPETEDVHAFVHRDGWIVSYYLRDEPAAKIIDWEDYDGEEITGTKLEDGVLVVCYVVLVPVGDIAYYDFRYPYANGLMIAADAQLSEGTDTFRLKLPSDLLFYERSYSHYAYDSYGSTMKIDEEGISIMGGSHASVTHYGLLSALQLWPDEFHIVSLWHDEHSGYDYTGEAFDAIVLIYQEP